MRHYELVFVVDPRETDEAVVALTDEYRGMITDGGGNVIKEESWGKRRLAFPIENFNEGRYVIFYVSADGANPFPAVQTRMEQNDKVLRYLTVRTDRLVEPSVAVDPVAEQEAS